LRPLVYHGYMRPLPPSARVPRLEDVAVRAKVSAATVSRFLNTPGVVAEATAARIREAIAATGYVQNLAAGGLASSRSRLIAVLVPDIAQSIFNDTVEAMIGELAPRWRSFRRIRVCRRSNSRARSGWTSRSRC
jgi:hypothetical protein